MSNHTYPIHIATGGDIPCEATAMLHFNDPTADPCYAVASDPSLSANSSSRPIITASEPSLMHCSCRWPILYNNNAGEQALLDANSLTYLRTETGWHRSDCPTLTLHRPGAATIIPS